MWGDHINKKLSPPFYALLQKQTDHERSEAAVQLLSALKFIFDDAHVTGPFLGGQQIQYADIMLAPFALRFRPILQHYRGFEVPKDWERYHKWYAAISQHPSNIPTMPTDESKFVQIYERYANNTAQSQVPMLQGKEIHYFDYHEVNPYNKSKEWLQINPKGLVPAFSYRGKPVYESSICLEFLEDAYPGTTRIFPDDPYGRAQERMWGDHISKKMTPPFYALLQRETTDARLEATSQLLSALKFIFDDANVTGPFLGGQQLQYADIMLAPFALRFRPILQHYRGFEVPKDWERYHKWYAAVSQHPSVVPTVADESKLVQMYERYADNTAQSEVADAIRKGTVLP